jgi:excisionase family DNA binding protein
MNMISEVKPREAAQQLGIGLDYLYRLIWSGKVLARKDEYGRWWIPLSSLASREARTEALK